MLNYFLRYSSELLGVEFGTDNYFIDDGLGLHEPRSKFDREVLLCVAHEFGQHDRPRPVLGRGLVFCKQKDFVDFLEEFIAQVADVLFSDSAKGHGLRALIPQFY